MSLECWFRHGWLDRIRIAGFFGYVTYYTVCVFVWLSARMSRSGSSITTISRYDLVKGYQCQRLQTKIVQPTA